MSITNSSYLLKTIYLTIHPSAHNICFWAFMYWVLTLHCCLCWLCEQWDEQEVDEVDERQHVVPEQTCYSKKKAEKMSNIVSLMPTDKQQTALRPKSEPLLQHRLITSGRNSTKMVRFKALRSYRVLQHPRRTLTRPAAASSDLHLHHLTFHSNNV